MLASREPAPVSVGAQTPELPGRVAAHWDSRQAFQSGVGSSNRLRGFEARSGDRIRTCDVRVMSPTSYQTSGQRAEDRGDDAKQSESLGGGESGGSVGGIRADAGRRRPVRSQQRGPETSTGHRASHAPELLMLRTGFRQSSATSWPRPRPVWPSCVL